MKRPGQLVETMNVVLKIIDDSFPDHGPRLEVYRDNHLATLGLDIGTRDMRRFCKRHDIKRDIQAGRPRKRIGAPGARNARSTDNRNERKAG
jgi:hypothetical protein